MILADEPTGFFGILTGTDLGITVLGSMIIALFGFGGLIWSSIYNAKKGREAEDRRRKDDREAEDRRSQEDRAARLEEHKRGLYQITHQAFRSEKVGHVIKTMTSIDGLHVAALNYIRNNAEKDVRVSSLETSARIGGEILENYGMSQFYLTNESIRAVIHFRKLAMGAIRVGSDVSSDQVVEAHSLATLALRKEVWPPSEET